MSKLSYDALAVEGLKKILKQISKVCTDLDIEFFIVGAIARNIWLVSNNKTASGTKDIDFGIYVPDENKFYKMKSVLIEKYGYQESRENAFCFLTPDGNQIDLLPFGEIENNNQVMIEGEGLTKVNLDGFKEAYNIGAKEVRIGEEVYRSCSVPAIVILKMIAFDDRPERRIKDIKDINSICQYYPDIESDLIWNNHNDLYTEDREHSDVAMIALGREMRKIIAENMKLEKRIITILDSAINQKSTFLSHMITNPEKETLEMKSSILSQIKQGIIGSL